MEERHIAIHLPPVEALCAAFDFTGLVIIRVDAQVIFLRRERFLTGIVKHDPERFQVTAIKRVALHVSRAVGGAAEGTIREKPSPTFQIKLRPVMAADVILGDDHAGLPARRDTGDSAEIDKQDGLYAAITA